MSDEKYQQALRKKLGATHRAPEMASITPASALRKSAVRAAQNLGGLVASVTALSEERVGVGVLVEDLPKQGLLLLLSGPEATHGLAVIDVQVVAAVVEHQTTGRVVPAFAEERKPTRTDAIILSDLIDRLLHQFELNLAPMEKAPPVNGYRFAAALEDPRAISLALEEMPYRRYRLQFDLGNGAKSGEISLVFPWFSASAQQLDARQSREWVRTLHKSVNTVQVSIEAELHRLNMSFAEITALEVGSLIEVPVKSLANVALVGTNGRCVARAKLGQNGGKRAVRILPAPNNAPQKGEAPLAMAPPAVPPMMPNNAMPAPPGDDIQSGTAALEPGG